MCKLAEFGLRALIEFYLKAWRRLGSSSPIRLAKLSMRSMHQKIVGCSNGHGGTKTPIPGRGCLRAFRQKTQPYLERQGDGLARVI